MNALLSPADQGGVAGAGGALVRGEQGRPRLSPGDPARPPGIGLEIRAEHGVEGGARVSGARLGAGDQVGVEAAQGVGGHESVSHRVGVPDDAGALGAGLVHRHGIDAGTLCCGQGHMVIGLVRRAGADGRLEEVPAVGGVGAEGGDLFVGDGAKGGGHGGSQLLIGAGVSASAIRILRAHASVKQNRRVR